MVSYVTLVLIVELLRHFTVCVSYTCTNGDEMTCSLGGKCINSKCNCDPTWTGENCEVLDLLPSNEYKAFYRESESSWGGSVMYSKKDSLYHMYVSDMAYNCTLNDYSTNSRVMHVTSNEPQGPYKYSNIAIPIWAHEPTIQFIATNNTYIIYHIGWGNRTNGWINCSNITRTKYKNYKYKYDNNTFPNRAITSDLNGIWINYQSSTAEEEWQCPQAYVYPNGSILYIKCREQCANTSLGGICFGIAMSESYDKPLEHIGQMSSDIYGEDGYFFRDNNGYFHMIYHTIQIGPRFPSHAFSSDGLTWFLATQNLSNPAFPFYYTLLNGTRVPVQRRERTQILLNENGLPSHIFNGVQPSGKDSPYAHFTFTGVQPINTSYK